MESKLGNKIKTLRERQGMKQGDLAEKLGISISHLSNFENGNRIPRLDMFKKLAEVFNIDIKELLDLPAQESQSELSSISLSDEQMDIFLADAFYSNNPDLLDAAVKDKENALKDKGIRINIRKFIMMPFCEQSSVVLQAVNNGDASLLNLFRFLSLNIIGQAINEGPIEKLREANDALGNFLDKLTRTTKETHNRIFGALLTLFQLTCQICAHYDFTLSWENRLFAKSKNCIPIPTPEQKQDLRALYNKEIDVHAVITMEDLRKVA